MGKEIVWEVEPVCRHGVGRDDRPECYWILVSAFISQDSYAPYREQDHSGLPDRIIEVLCLDSRIGSRREVEGSAVVVPQPFYEYVIGFPEYVQLFLRDVAYDPDSEGRSREGMPSDKFFLDSEGPADATDLVIEKHTEGLHYSHVHTFWQSTHVVVGFDLRGYSLDASGFYDIRVDGSLG